MFHRGYIFATKCSIKGATKHFGGTTKHFGSTTKHFGSTGKRIGGTGKRIGGTEKTHWRHRKASNSQPRHNKKHDLNVNTFVRTHYFI